MSKSKDSTEAAVQKYLTDQNRPYSVNDIVLNLHKEHGKTAVQKALDSLVQDGRVREKTYGKQKVYLIDQGQLSEVSPEEIRSMDDQVTELEKVCKQNQEEVKAAQMQLKLLNSSMSTEEAKALVAKLTTETDDLSAKYKLLSEAQGEVISREERKAIRSNRENALKHWRSRKRMCMRIVDAILESSDKKKSTFLEEVGIETDEDSGVSMPTM